jgi:hypothetical protein
MIAVYRIIERFACLIVKTSYVARRCIYSLGGASYEPRKAIGFPRRVCNQLLAFRKAKLLSVDFLLPFTDAWKFAPLSRRPTHSLVDLILRQQQYTANVSVLKTPD